MTSGEIVDVPMIEVDFDSRNQHIKAAGRYVQMLFDLAPGWLVDDVFG